MSSKETASVIVQARIEGRILVLRGQKVMVDADLAELYGVPTKALNQAIKRNRTRFPSDFMFELTPEEKAEVVSNCDHLSKLKYSRTLPYAFTEHGAIQASNVLLSDRAVEMGIHIVRAFVRLKEASLTHAELALRLNELEAKTENLVQGQDTTRTQLHQLFEALRSLMAQPAPAPKRPIGFITPSDH